MTVTVNSPFQDYPHPDDHTTQSTVTPGFKTFTERDINKRKMLNSFIKSVGVLGKKFESPMRG